MEFLNRTVSQLTDLYRSLTPSGRLTLGVLVLAILGSIIFLARVDVGGSDEYFLQGKEFSVNDITKLEAAFAHKGLGGSRLDGQRIRIPRGKKLEYLAAALEGNALPQSMNALILQALTEDNSMWLGPADVRQQRVKYLQELTLARIISAMKGVEEATVHFDQALESRFPRKMKKTALVGVRAKEGRALGETQVRAICDTVAAYFVGLERSMVTVTDLNREIAYPQGIAGGGDVNPYLINKQMFESEWRNKIYERLSMYEGIVVGVDVELDPTIDKQRREIKLDQPVSLESEEISLTTSGAAPRDHSAPESVVGNQSRSVSASSQTETRSRQTSVPGTTAITSGFVGLTPTHVRASVGVPSDLYLEIWRKRISRQNPEAIRQPAAAELLKIEQETLQNIEDAVSSLLPTASFDLGRLSTVSVKTYENLLAAPQPAPDQANAYASWLAGNWPTLAMLALGALSLLVLRKVALSGRRSGTQGRASLDEYAGGEGALEEGANALRQRIQNRGPDLRSQLSEIVREDPDAAADVLRTWIGDAA